MNEDQVKMTSRLREDTAETSVDVIDEAVRILYPHDHSGSQQSSLDLPLPVLELVIGHHPGCRHPQTAGHQSSDDGR